MMPNTLDFKTVEGLGHKEPRGSDKPVKAKREKVASSAPSRPVIFDEPKVDEVNERIFVQGPASTISRFKKLCKDDRRSYHDMLCILMDSFENKS